MSANTSTPLVTVVIPVYNGEQYLAQCIDSVLAQTYENWQCLIVDNRSTDNSLQIATGYADKDSRITVLRTQEHLKALHNWNYAVSRMSPETRYCKIVHADDWMFPECLRRMVEVAEAHPTTALVSCAVLLEKTLGDSPVVDKSVLNPQMPAGDNVAPGREVARGYLLGELRLTCTQSSQLLRWDAARRSRPLYDDTTGILSALDRQVFLELLEHGDFGFVPEVLTGSREHAHSMTSTVYGHGVSFSEKLRLIRRFGPIYLSPEESNACWKRELSAYSRFLGRSAFLFRGKEFWQYHRGQLQQLGCRLNLFSSACGELVRALASPLSWMGRRGRLMLRRDPVTPQSVSRPGNL